MFAVDAVVARSPMRPQICLLQYVLLKIAQLICSFFLGVKLLSLIELCRSLAHHVV